MTVDERSITFEVVHVLADPDTGKVVVDVDGRGGRLGGLRLRQTYNANSVISRAALQRLLDATGVAVDDHGGFNGSDLVGTKFVADIGERERLGLFWHHERAIEEAA